MAGSSDDMHEPLNIKPPQSNHRKSHSNRSPKRHKGTVYSSRSPYRNSHRRNEDDRSRRRHHHHKHRHSHRSGRDLREVLHDKRERRVILAREDIERNVDKFRVKVERQVIVEEVRYKHYDKYEHRKASQTEDVKRSLYFSNKRHISNDGHSYHRKRHKRDRSSSHSDSDKSTKSGWSSNKEAEVTKVDTEDLTPKPKEIDPVEVVESSSSSDSDGDSDDSSSTKTAESDNSSHSGSEQENDVQSSPVKKEVDSSESDDDNEVINSPVKKGSNESEDTFLETSKKEGDVEESPSLSSDSDVDMDSLPPYLPAIQGCRSVEEFQCLNKIEEGSFGIVYRAQDKRTKEMVALKKLKMAKEKEGFPITSLREINTLLKAQHPNIVTVREIVVGSNIDQVYIVMDFVDQDLNALMKSMKKKNQICYLTPLTAAA